MGTIDILPSHIYNFEGELCPIYQPNQPFSQDNAHINIANITQE